MDSSDPRSLTEETFSEEQIEELLQRAQAQLREQQSYPTQEDGRNTEPVFIPRLLHDKYKTKPYISSHGQVAQVDSARLLDLYERQCANGMRKVEDPLLVKQRKVDEKRATAGEKWFNMPKTLLTPELRRDLQLIKMRNVLDPHRHYKKENSKTSLPEFSQVGTLVEGPTEFFSGRLQNAQRKRTLVEEVLAGEQKSGHFKRKYANIQQAKTSGKKGHYKAQITKRYGDDRKRIRR